MPYMCIYMCHTCVVHIICAVHVHYILHVPYMCTTTCTVHVPYMCRTCAVLIRLYSFLVSNLEQQEIIEISFLLLLIIFGAYSLHRRFAAAVMLFEIIPFMVMPDVVFHTFSLVIVIKIILCVCACVRACVCVHVIE